MSLSAGSTSCVYIRDKDNAWIPAEVVSESSGNISVRINHKFDDLENCSPGELRDVKLKDYEGGVLPLQNLDNDTGNLIECSDMVDLPFLHEAAILYNLKIRHKEGKPYTRTGDIVIAVNPYQWMNQLYSDETRYLYADKLIWTQTKEDAKSLVEPHVYETSSLSYRGLAVDGMDQSVLVSGESGAGKTETVKILMNHLASVQNMASGNESDGEVNDIVKRVRDSNPLLEAFGNAKTTRNDNSSRFGKYIQLQFDAEDPRQAAFSGRSVPSCILAGSKCSTYLLEKSRVVSHEEGERAFHIFYQILGAPQSERENLWKEGLGDATEESFRYVGYTDTHEIEGKSDGERFYETVSALDLIGVNSDSLHTLLRAMCIVLQLGNLVFDKDPENDENSTITSSEELSKLARLMGVDEDDISKALTIRTMVARNETYKVPLNKSSAEDSCDAFAKEIYSQSFDWLVRTINSATCAEDNYIVEKNEKAPSKFGMIGLLDIFGFESFKVNRFEQLCINYANEKLQQKFTIDIFRSVQAEYEYEGIELGDIQFEDNAGVLDLVEGRMGIIAVLNEECVRPRGNDISFVSKVNAMNKDSESLTQSRLFRDNEFGVHHYAGPVKYDATNFVKKNTDVVPQDLLQCACKSTNSLVRIELKASADRKAAAAESSSSRGGRRGGSLVSQTVCTKFKGDLGSLMTNIGTTRSRYIRCLKPNTKKQPYLMMHNSSVEQLRCAGVVAAVTISRSAFPNRLDLETALERFSCLTNSQQKHSMATGDINTRLEKLLDPLLKDLETKKEGKILKGYVCGKTRIYFRAGALEFLESQRISSMGSWATEIQRRIRGFVALAKFISLRSSAIKVQAVARSYAKQRLFHRSRRALISIQNWVRGINCRAALDTLRKNTNASKIQSYWRMVKAVSSLAEYRVAAVIIQSQLRGARQRPIYRAALAESIEESKFENQLKSLQRKLEEAEKRRIEAEKKRLEAEKRAAEAPEKIVVVHKEVPSRSNSAAYQQLVTQNDTEAQELIKRQQKQIDDQYQLLEQQRKDQDERDNQQMLVAKQQQTLMDESGKMLEYLRKEVFKLRSQNSQLRTDFDLLKENNKRLMDANASAGASFAALNQHSKGLNKTNSKLKTELQKNKQQVTKMNLTQIELKEELKMKQATYISEVHTRLQYQKTMQKIVEGIQERCPDENLVEDILALSDDCESDYMNGPTGMVSAPSPAKQVTSIFSSMASPAASMGADESLERSTSISGRFMSFFGGTKEPEAPAMKTIQDKPQLANLQSFGGSFSEA